MCLRCFELIKKKKATSKGVVECTKCVDYVRKVFTSDNSALRFGQTSHFKLHRRSLFALRGELRFQQSSEANLRCVGVSTLECRKSQHRSWLRFSTFIHLIFLCSVYARETVSCSDEWKQKNTRRISWHDEKLDFETRCSVHCARMLIALHRDTESCVRSSISSWKQKSNKTGMRRHHTVVSMQTKKEVI